MDARSRSLRQCTVRRFSSAERTCPNSNPVFVVVYALPRKGHIFQDVVSLCLTFSRLTSFISCFVTILIIIQEPTNSWSHRIFAPSWSMSCTWNRNTMLPSYLPPLQREHGCPCLSMSSRWWFISKTPKLKAFLLQEAPRSLVGQYFVHSRIAPSVAMCNELLEIQMALRLAFQMVDIWFLRVWLISFLVRLLGCWYFLSHGVFLEAEVDHVEQLWPRLPGWCQVSGAWQERGPRPGRPCEFRVSTNFNPTFFSRRAPCGRRFADADVFFFCTSFRRETRSISAGQWSTQCRAQGVAVASLPTSHSGREKDRHEDTSGNDWAVDIIWHPTDPTPRAALTDSCESQGHGRAHLGALVPTWEQNHSWQVGRDHVYVMS